MLRELVPRLKECGITLAVSGARHQVLEVMERTGLTRDIGAENCFGTDEVAIDSLRLRLAQS